MNTCGCVLLGLLLWIAAICALIGFFHKFGYHDDWWE